MHKHLSNIGLGGVTVVAVMGLLSLVGGLMSGYNLNSVNSIVFTTQQLRSATSASAQARLNQRKQVNSNFVATVVTQASSALGVVTSNPGNNLGANYPGTPLFCTPNCNDGNDNDGDSYIDKKDRTCYDQPNGGGLFHNDRDESMGNCTPPPAPPSKYSCNNYQCVVDPNGTMDLPTCQSTCKSNTPPPPPPGSTSLSSFCAMDCNDSRDNDGDNTMDKSDPQCNDQNMGGYVPRLDEKKGLQCVQIICQASCSNNVDDNGNGLTDDKDPNCIDLSTNKYNPNFSELFGGVCYNWKMSHQPKYSCNNYQCVVDPNGTMDLPTCQSTCKSNTPPPPPPPSGQCGQQTSPICDSYTDPLRKGECNNLMWLYTCTDGPNWTDKTSWNTSTDYCSWYGVTCTQGLVTQLNLNSNQLSGPMPTMEKLSKLLIFNISFNAGISNYENLDNSNIQILNISNNNLITIPNLTKLSKLTTLYLNGNSRIVDFSPIEQLQNLVGLEMRRMGLIYLPNIQWPLSLKVLQVAYNKIINFDNFSHPNVETLAAQWNSINTYINLNTLPNLKNLYLGGNKLGNQTIPFESSKLELLDLAANKLTQLPDMSKLSNLKGLYIHEQQSGYGISGDPRSVIEKLNLTQLCIGSNKFTGLGDANSGWLKDYQTIKNITNCRLSDNLVQR